MKNELNYYRNKKIELENFKNETNKINLLDKDLKSKIKECEKIIKNKSDDLNKLISTKNKIDGYKKDFNNSKKACILKTIGFSTITTLISASLASMNPALFATFPLTSSFISFTIIEVLVYFNETRNTRKLVKTTNYDVLKREIRTIENDILNQTKKINVYEHAKVKYNKFLDNKEKEIKVINNNIKLNKNKENLDIENTVKTK